MLQVQQLDEEKDFDPCGLEEAAGLRRSFFEDSVDMTGKKNSEAVVAAVVVGAFVAALFYDVFDAIESLS